MIAPFKKKGGDGRSAPWMAFLNSGVRIIRRDERPSGR